jgi:glycosyltransferase involved in cell wall biosynthesis
MKLSIITINYNNAEGLRKTLASVASQTYADIEHIIVDGGSTDGSVEIIREYVCANGAQGGGSQTCRTGQTSRTKVCHQIRWISEPDKGIYNAMNKGIRMATGEYIEILNSGDILAADDVTERMMAALAQQVKGMENEVKGYRLKVKGEENSRAEINAYNLSSINYKLNTPIFYGNMIKEYPDGRRVVDRCQAKDYTPESFYYFYRGTLNHDCAYIRRDLFEKYGLYNEDMKICSDWEWYVRAIVLGGEKTVYTNIDVTVFDMTGISESNGKNKDIILKERCEYLESILPAAVLRDYDMFSLPIEQYRRLKKYHLWGVVYFVERVLFKFEKWFCKR